VQELAHYGNLHQINVQLYIFHILTLLVIINHGDSLLAGRWTLREGVKIALTYVVPYGVSTYASVASIRKMEKEGRDCL